MYADFMGRAGDEIFNQLAKWQAMSAGTLTMPVVLRISVGVEVRRAAFAGLDARWCTISRGSRWSTR